MCVILTVVVGISLIHGERNFLVEMSWGLSSEIVGRNYGEEMSMGKCPDTNAHIQCCQEGNHRIPIN